MKKKLLTLVMAFVFLTTQMSFLTGTKANAETGGSGAEIVVLGPNGQLIKDYTNKTNALEGLNEVIEKNGYLLVDNNNDGFIDGIKNKSNPQDESLMSKMVGSDWLGWMYTVNRNGEYDASSSWTGIKDFTLKTGDRLIFYYSYYGAAGSTMLANKIEFSKKISNTSINISLKNLDSWSGKETTLSFAEAKIDGKDVNVVDGNIKLENGLSEGLHTLEISDWVDNGGVPKIVADKFEFNIEKPSASVRVEGLNGTIVEGSAEGDNALEIVKAVLNKNNIPFTTAKSSWGSNYVDSINGLKEKNFKGFDGWLFYVKKPNMIVSPNVGMDGYIPDKGDNIVVYYGESATPYVNNIAFIPSSGSVIKENTKFKIKFSYKFTKWDVDANGNWIPSDTEAFIKNAIVNIDNLNYITDENGEIALEGLQKGTHTYKISGYNIDKLPTVVMDKGVFVIDNIHNPSMNFEDSKYDDLYDSDNTIIKKDLEKELNATLSYIKNNSKDTWASISLNKFGIKSDEEFIKSSAADIAKYGVKDYLNTDLERLILSLTANGYTPYNFAGHNLVEELFNRDLDEFLINDALFGLIVYKYSNVNESYNITREKLVDFILSKTLSYKSGENEIFGWALSGDKINPDITGGVINALSEFYQDNERVKAAVDKAVKSLSLLQNQSGYLADSYGVFSESISFTILGLTSIGINPEGVEFTKTKGDLFSGLLSFKGSSGQFKHSLEGKDNYIATEQALRALIAIKEYKKLGKYDFFKSSINARELPVYVFAEKNEPAPAEKKNNNTQNTGAKQTTNDIAEALIEEVTNKSLEFNVSNTKDEILKAIGEASDKAVIRVDASSNPVVEKDVFDAIKGQDKLIIFEINGFKWAFNGLDINKDTKNIDLSLNKEAEYKNEISSIVDNQEVVILSFKNNGVLPGKASITFKLDSNWLNGKDKNNLYLYYYNPDTKKTELVEGPLTLNENGEATIHIEHCSDYFITDKKIEAVKKVVKTQNSNRGLAIAGGTIAALGLALIVLMLKSKKEAIK